MDCFWVKLKNVGPPVFKFISVISKCHLHSWKIILNCYVVVISQMKGCYSVYLTYVYVSISPLVFSQTSTTHQGIFLLRALWANRVSPPINNIASRDRFKSIGIEENFGVSHKR